MAISVTLNAAGAFFLVKRKIRILEENAEEELRILREEIGGMRHDIFLDRR